MSHVPMTSGQGATTLHRDDSGAPLDEGTFRIEYLGEGLIILANQASEQQVLARLAEDNGFQLVDHGVLSGSVTLTLEAGSVHAALVELLKQYPYEIIYENDKDFGMDKLAQVIVGESSDVQSQSPMPVQQGGLAETGGRVGNLPSAADVRLSDQEQVLLGQLVDPSAEVRAEAAENIEAKGAALNYLATIITSDPSPEVRAAAAYSLKLSEDPRAVDALITGLDDADPEVLVTVIDALWFAEDRRAIPHLQRFLDHPDADVRETAEFALESFE